MWYSAIDGNTTISATRGRATPEGVAGAVCDALVVQVPYSDCNCTKFPAATEAQCGIEDAMSPCRPTDTGLHGGLEAGGGGGGLP